MRYINVYVLYFDADQGLIGKIARFDLKKMDFQRSHGSHMGLKGCYGADILPKEINLAC